MTEKATFCPVCGGMRVGVHGKDHAVLVMTSRTIKADPVPLPIAPPEVVEEVARFAKAVEAHEAAKAKFDKTAYQREYMRQRRAKQKAKP